MATDAQVDVRRFRAYFQPSLLASSAILCLCGFFAQPAALGAQDSSGAQQPVADLNQLSLEQLGNIEVTTVSKDPRQVQKTPAAVFVITRDDIRRSGATSIPEALRLAPGVEVARIDADHWSVAIRGFAGQFSKNLLVLIDGRSVYTPLFSGVYWDVQNVMLEDVDRIEVVRGPGGTIWGANAVNGVINIITRSADETHGISSTLGGGNVDQGTADARFGRVAGNDFNYRLYAMGMMRGAESHPDDNTFDHWRMGQAGFRTDWTRGDKDNFTVQGDIYRGESGASALIASFSPIAELAAEGKAYVSGGNLLARWQRKIADGSDLQFQAYFDRTNRHDFELGETRDTFDLDFIQHARIHGDQELTWGLGARISPSNFIQSSDGVSFTPTSQTDSIYSGFAQYELPIVRDKLALTAGTKLEHNNFSGFDYQPSVRLLWSPTEHQSFWAAVTRAVRTPSRVDQDVQFLIVVQATPPPPVFFDIVGDPDLKAEKLIAYEAGYRNQVNRRLYLDFAAFYNVHNDLQGYGPIGLGQSTNPPPLNLLLIIPYANAIEGRTAGTEIAPSWEIASWWRLRATYSFLHMDLKDKPGFTDVGNLLGTYMGSSPSHVGSIESLINLPGHFEFDQTYRYNSGLAEYNVHTYNTADARLGWHTDRGFGLSVSGQNLLRPSHPEFGGDPGPLVGIKRSIYARLTWTK